MELSQIQIKNPAVGTADLSERAASLRDAAAAQANPDALRSVAQKFEGIFVHQILKQMQETVENASFDPEDNAGKQVHSMYCSFMADAVSQQGGLGMCEQIHEQLVRMNEASQHQPPAGTQLDEQA
jgi:flagellar protein FlgJ